MRESPEFEVIAGAEHPQLPEIRTTLFSCLSSYLIFIYPGIKSNLESLFLDVLFWVVL